MYKSVYCMYTTYIGTNIGEIFPFYFVIFYVDLNEWNDYFQMYFSLQTVIHIPLMTLNEYIVDV